MKLSLPVKIAYRSLQTARLRFFLTVLGVVIGVAAVILVMGIGASTQRLVLSQVENIGSNLIGILPGASEEDGPPASALGIVTTTLTNDDLFALRDPARVPHLLAVSGYVTGSATVSSKRESFEATFQGVSPSMAGIENIKVAKGRFFYPEEERDLSRVTVLGAERAQDLFPNRSALGETIEIKDTPFKVIGVLEARGSAAFSNPDVLVYVPLETAQKLLLGIDYLNFARGKVDTPENIEQSMASVERVLRDRHDLKAGEESDFSVRSTAAALGILTKVTDILAYFLLSIAALSLLVGGIGIMNSMLISVSQRVREIGLRKAVGAKRAHILLQFLLESSVITLFGGIIGILFGVGVTYLVSVIIPRLGYDWVFIVPLISVILGFVVSLAIGIIFGLYPAFKAARTSPMEALRYE
jgi:putative ABC transport system permease protein